VQIISNQQVELLSLKVTLTGVDIVKCKVKRWEKTAVQCDPKYQSDETKTRNRAIGLSGLVEQMLASSKNYKKV